MVLTHVTRTIRTDRKTRNRPALHPASKEWMALGCSGEQRDFAGIAVFLASDESSYISGTTIFVDEGFLGM